MSFRDDGDAARERANALARELDEKDAEIEALRAQLEQKDEALREAKDDASPILEAAERAKHALEALKRKGSEAATRAPKDVAPRVEEERECERRRLSSVSVWGDLDMTTLAVIALTPTLLATLLLATMRWSGYGVVVPACAGLLLLAIHYYGRDWARRQWRLEEQWAKTRPYRLLGYPESLEKRPASLSALPFLRLNDSEHRQLELELDFAGGAIPAGLADIMSGFDDSLSTTSPFRESPIDAMERRIRGEPDTDATKPNVFYRKSPVRTARSKSGISRTVDDNRAVRDFVRRLDREVLGPLHARHALTQVALRLS